MSTGLLPPAPTVHRCDQHLFGLFTLAITHYHRQQTNRLTDRLMQEQTWQPSSECFLCLHGGQKQKITPKGKKNLSHKCSHLKPYKTDDWTTRLCNIRPSRLLLSPVLWFFPRQVVPSVSKPLGHVPTASVHPVTPACHHCQPLAAAAAAPRITPTLGLAAATFHTFLSPAPNSPVLSIRQKRQSYSTFRTTSAIISGLNCTSDIV